jgi:hypothetical protein
MLKTLLCKMNLGHHWVGETDKDGNFRRKCRNCGKYDRRAKWSGHLADGDHPVHPNSRTYWTS